MNVERTKVLITCSECFEDVILQHTKDCSYDILYIIEGDEVFVFDYNTRVTTNILNQINTYKHTLKFVCPEAPSTALTLLFYALCTEELDAVFSIYLDDCLEFNNEFEEDLVTKWIEQGYYATVADNGQ